MTNPSFTNSLEMAGNKNWPCLCSKGTGVMLIYIFGSRLSWHVFVFVSTKSSATLLAMGAAGSAKSPQASEKAETSIVPGKQEGVGECEIDNERKGKETISSTVPGTPVKPTKRLLKFPKLQVRKFPTPLRPFGGQAKEGASKMKQNESLPRPLLESEQEGAGECEIDEQKLQLHHPCLVPPTDAADWVQPPM